MIWLLGRRLHGKFPMLPSFAAAMAFYFLVSLVPFLVIVSRCVGAVFSTNLAPELLSFLGEILPPESRFGPQAVADTITQGSRGLTAVSAVLAVWTASSGLNEVARAVHFLSSDPERPNPGGWARRGRAFGVLAIWAVAIGVVGLSFVILPLVQGKLASAARYPTAFIAMFGAFSATYVFVPEKRPSWSAAAVGGASAAAFWTGVSVWFGYLLPKVWHVSVFNGALSSVLAVLVWAYFGAWGVIVGSAVTVRVDEA